MTSLQVQYCININDHYGEHTIESVQDCETMGDQLWNISLNYSAMGEPTQKNEAFHSTKTDTKKDSCQDDQSKYQNTQQEGHRNYGDLVSPAHKPSLPLT